MKTFEYTFSTTIEFSGNVREHAYVLRCLPRRGEGVTVLEEELVVEPGPRYARQRDSFGNELAVGSVREPHGGIGYYSSGVVRIDLSGEGALGGGGGVGAGARDSHGTAGSIADPGAHPLFRYASPLAAADDAIRLWAEARGCGSAAFAGGGDAALEALGALGAAVHEHMAYAPGTTSVGTTASQAFAAREGVCQDFAHIMIVALRAAGVAARYVSGLAAGQGTTHAWVQAFVDGAWRGYDPTRDVFVDEDYLPLAVGRDWSDCPVERGSFWGLVDQTQTVFMTMRECGEPGRG